MKNSGVIKGWDFSRFYAADGSVGNTLDSLNAQKSKLEARLLAIPKQISSLQQNITSMQRDYDWLSSLNSRRQKNYEKENGVHPHVVSGRLKTKIASAKATITSLNTEKSRIPSQIEAIQKQIDTLIKGESDGLSKGLDKESAKALGEIELEKEKAQLKHQTKIQEIEEQKAIRLAESQISESSQNSKSNKGLYIGIGITVLLIIAAIVLYKRSLTRAKLQTAAS